MSLFIYNEQKWRSLNLKERKFFAQIVLECLCWNHYLDDDTGIEGEDNVSRELEFSFIGKYQPQLRDALWWHCLKSACYQELSPSTAIEESALGALFGILRECVQNEIELGADYILDSDDPSFTIYYYTRYRSFIEKVYRGLYHVDCKTPLYDNPQFSVRHKLEILQQIKTEKLQGIIDVEEFNTIISAEDLSDIEELFANLELELPEVVKAIAQYRIYNAQFNPVTPCESEALFKNDNVYYWNNLLAALEDAFTAGDDDYQCQEEWRIGIVRSSDPKYEQRYFGENTILKQIQSNLNCGYWELLFACLEERSLPKFNDLECQSYQNLLETLRNMTPKRIALLEKILITNSFILRTAH